MASRKEDKKERKQKKEKKPAAEGDGTTTLVVSIDDFTRTRDSVSPLFLLSVLLLSPVVARWCWRCCCCCDAGRCPQQQHQQQHARALGAPPRAAGPLS